MPAKPGETPTGGGTGKRVRRGLVEAQVRDIAAEVFAAKGVAGTRLQDIADALGTSRTALYHYYPGKDELLGALVEELSREAMAVLRAVVEWTETADPAEQVRIVVRDLVRLYIDRPPRARLLERALQDLPPAVDQTIRALNREFFRELAALIRGGIEAGVFADLDERVAAHTIAGMTRSVSWWFDPAGPRTADAVADQIAHMAVSSLLVSPAGRAAPAAMRESVTRLRAELDVLERALTPSTERTSQDDC
ncbi:TetR/AcrR family transcriptional regulator [Frankia sp. Cr2]|uniref:TetR/AcrR family transcriptional regulator n=1 Tax=Frankia sp. Cr2 TaxID=3073932 RepID=UPI002AD3BB3E|nr:TetR/AcrR family transcriptional regulator [Frankia sp. Cr2]